MAALAMLVLLFSAVVGLAAGEFLYGRRRP